MSFTIVTDVFCDYCNNWMSEQGGISGIKVEKVKAWKKAQQNGWVKHAENRHACPECVKRWIKEEGLRFNR